MAVTPTNGYCTGGDLKSALQIPAADTDDDSDLTIAIDAASRTIDRWCGRRFYADASDTTRYFTPSSRRRVPLHGDPTATDLVSATSVTVTLDDDNNYDTTWTEGTDFVLGPRSAGAANMPYTQLTIIQGRVSVPVGLPESVKVIGTFGWNFGVPDEIERACVSLASQVFKQIREAPFGQASFDLEGGMLRMSRFLPGNVEMLLRPFRRVTFPGNV